MRSMHIYRVAARAVPLVVGALVLGACDVTNPGQILDEDLNGERAMGVLVTGMAGDFAVGLRDIGWNNAVLTGDLAGTSAYLSRQRHWAGNPDPEDADEYNSVHAARWVAAQGIERMQSTLGDAFDRSPLAAEAHLWAGYSNRLLGETMCQAVIDGGSPQPRDVYFQAAEDHFSEAIRIAENAGAAAAEIQTAALGGRASVRIVLGEWDQAVADARQVPTDFVFYARYNSTSGREMNRIWNETQSRVNLNVKHTFFEQYYPEFQDERVRWFRNPDVTTAADGVTEQLMQGKYNEWGSDIPLTKGSEMRLIEAEALIREGRWQEGLAIINQLRTAAGVEPWTATNAEEAFDRLQKERAIVLWMEARRGGDLYRWGGDPESDPLLQAMHASAPEDAPLAGRAICHPFSQTMYGTNSNL